MSENPRTAAETPPSTPASPERVRVAVVFGGRSTEHAVSCATAASVLEAIDRDRYDVVPVGITRQGRWVLAADDPEPLRIAPGHLPEVPDGPDVLVPLDPSAPGLRVQEPGAVPAVLAEVDVVLPLLHGPFGEDGTIQGLLELAGIRYAGCGVLASAAMMDKHMMKLVFEGAGLRVGPYVVATDRAWAHEREDVLARAAALTLPLFVKPARAGSSVGITRVDDLADLPAAVERAREHDPKVLIEQGVDGREVEVGVLQGRDGAPPRVSVVGEIAVSGGHTFYDFEAKYLDEANVALSIPADVPAGVPEELERIARVAFDAAGCEGLARVDCFLTPDGAVLINEINTMPGFTPFSMYPQVWAASGITYPDLITELIELARERPLGLR